MKPADDAETVAKRLSEGALNILLHIARVVPLPEPYPPPEIGQFHLRELMTEGLIARISETRFKPTAAGYQVAAFIQRAARALADTGATEAAAAPGSEES